MSDEDLVDEVMERVQRMLEEDVCDLFDLPREMQVVVLVTSAQGVLDNGGFQFFFESDWQGEPDYEHFAAAYEAIGHPSAAAELRRVVATFPFANPHLDRDARNAFLAENQDPTTGEIRGWGDALCGDEQVWLLLSAYCEAHRDRLGF